VAEAEHLVRTLGFGESSAAAKALAVDCCVLPEAISPAVDKAAANAPSVVVPAILIFSANAWTLWSEHWEHEAHSPPRSERPQYPYMNIRTKSYPWGNGKQGQL